MPASTGSAIAIGGALWRRGAVLLICALGFAGAVPATEGPARPPAAVETMGREILRELVETKSTITYGSTAAAKAVEARLLAAGFAREDVHFAVPDGHPDKGNVVVRLRGTGHAKPILYLCHLDVVEAKREDWTVEPFHLTERDGWLYGRGTMDMKGQDAAVLTSLIRARQEGFVPARDVIVAFTADEEGGDVNGVDWLYTNRPEWIEAAFVVNPDGGEAGYKHGRKLYVGLQTSEKMYAAFQLEVTDKGGHGSRPTPANPIFRLARALDRLSHYEFPVHLTDTTRLYFTRRAQLESGQVQADMRAVTRMPANPAALRRLSAVVETNIVLRSTCTATLLEGGHAENALPQRATAVIQCRLIPGETASSAEDTIRHVVNDATIAVTPVRPSKPSPESAPTPAILAAVEKVTASLWPGVIVLPQMSPGASDSIYSRSRGVPSYGIDGAFDDLDDARVHGRDERIGVSAFGEELEFTYRLMRELASTP
jgi:acetylornithine deacetylase/succinyl-diaminopimelate desuccinylase-like protein